MRTRLVSRDREHGLAVLLALAVVVLIVAMAAAITLLSTAASVDEPRQAPTVKGT